MSLGIEELLAPVDVDSFMAKTWGQTWQLIPGDNDKFDGLASWPELNQWLASDLLFPPRLRLFKDGSPVNSSKFMYTRPGGSPSMNPAGLTAALADGAALSVDLVDRLFPAVRQTVGRLEQFFGTSAHVNLYAGWRTNNGFGVHWDPQEVFVLQVDGCKEWQVHEPTRLHPLAGDTPPKPQGDPVWQGTLTPGDLLYLPRGWWHMARPLDEPSLHLTLTVVPPVAPDFVAWKSKRMPDDPAVRANLPRLGDAISAPTPLAGAAESMPAFLTDWASQTWVRPSFDLPRSAQRPVAELSGGTGLRLAMSTAVSVQLDVDETARVRSGSAETVLSQRLLPALHVLSGDDFVTVDDMAAHLEAAEDRVGLLDALATLLELGAFWTRGAL